MALNYVSRPQTGNVRMLSSKRRLHNLIFLCLCVSIGHTAELLGQSLNLNKNGHPAYMLVAEQLAGLVQSYLEERYDYKLSEGQEKQLNKATLTVLSKEAGVPRQRILWLADSGELLTFKWDGQKKDVPEEGDSNSQAGFQIAGSTLRKQSRDFIPELCATILTEFRRVKPVVADEAAAADETPTEKPSVQFDDEVFSPFITISPADTSAGAAVLECSHTVDGHEVEIHDVTRMNEPGVKGSFRVPLETDWPKNVEFPFGKETTLSIEFEDIWGNRAPQTVTLKWPKGRSGNLIPLPFIFTTPIPPLIGDAGTVTQAIELKTAAGVAKKRRFRAPDPKGGGDFPAGYASDFPTALRAGNDEWIRLATIQRLLQLKLIAAEAVEDRRKEVCVWGKINEAMQPHVDPSMLTDDGLSSIVTSLLNGFTGNVGVTAPPVHKLSEAFDALQLRELLPVDLGGPLNFNWTLDACNCNSLATLNDWCGEQGYTLREKVFERAIEVEIPIKRTIQSPLSVFQALNRQFDGINADLALEVEGDATFSLTGMCILRGLLSKKPDGTDQIAGWTVQFRNLEVKTAIASPAIAGQAQLGLLSFGVESPKTPTPFAVKTPVKVNNEQALQLNDQTTWAISYEPPTVKPFHIILKSASSDINIPLSLKQREDKQREESDDKNKNKNKTEIRNNALFEINFAELKMQNVFTKYQSIMQTPITATTSIVGVYGDALQAALRSKQFGGQKFPILSGHSLKTLLNFDEAFRQNVIEKLDDTFKRASWKLPKGLSLAAEISLRINGIDLTVSAAAENTFADRLTSAVEKTPAIADLAGDITFVDGAINVPRGTRIAIKIDNRWVGFYPLETPSLDDILACLPNKDGAATTLNFDKAAAPDTWTIHVTIPRFDWTHSRKVPLGSVPGGNGIGDISFSGDTHVSVNAVLKIPEITFSLTCSPLAKDFQIDEQKKLTDLPAWEKFIQKSPKAEGTIELQFSDGRRMPLLLKELVKVEDLKRLFAAAEVEMTITAPPQARKNDNRFSFKEVQRTVSRNRTPEVVRTETTGSQAADKENESKPVPVFQISPFRDPQTKRIDAAGYQIGMALGIFGSDVDDDGIIIGPPLHGESWSDDRITFSPITLAADLGLEFAAGAKLRPTSYGFLTVEGDLNQFKCVLTGTCTVARSEEGELKPDQSERREGRKFSVAGAINAGCDGGLTLAAKVNPLGLEYDLSIPLISDVPSLTKKGGGDRLSQRLAEFSFADRSLSLDWRMDELPDSNRKSLLGEIAQLRGKDETQFDSLKKVEAWLNKHPRVNWTLAQVPGVNPNVLKLQPSDSIRETFTKELNDETLKSLLSDLSDLREDYYQTQLVVLRDLKDWLRTHYQVNLAIHSRSIALSENFPESLHGLNDAVSVIEFAPSLLRVFEQALSTLRQMEKADGLTLSELNISLADLSSMTESFERMLARIRNESPATLPDLLANLLNLNLNLEQDVEKLNNANGVWVVDLKQFSDRKSDEDYIEKLVIKLDLQDALQFTWFRQEQAQREFSVRLPNSGMLSFDVKPVPTASVTGQVAISFGVDLTRLNNESTELQECFFVGCADLKNITTIVETTDEKLENNLKALVGKTFIAGRIDTAASRENGMDTKPYNVKATLLQGIVSASATLDIPTDFIDAVVPLPKPPSNADRHYAGKTGELALQEKPTLAWDSKKWNATITKQVESLTNRIANTKPTLNLSGLGTAMDTALSRLFGDLRRELKELDSVPIVGGKFNLAFEELDSLLNAFRNQNRSLRFEVPGWDAVSQDGQFDPNKFNNHLKDEVGEWWKSAFGDSFPKGSSARVVITWPERSFNNVQNLEQLSTELSRIVAARELKLEIPLNIEKNVKVNDVPLDLKLPGLGFRMDDDAKIEINVTIGIHGKLLLEGTDVKLAAVDPNTPAKIVINPRVTLPARLGTAKNPLASIEITTNGSESCGSGVNNGVNLNIAYELTNRIDGVAIFDAISLFDADKLTLSGDIGLPLLLTATASDENIPRVKSGLIVKVPIPKEGIRLDMMGDYLAMTDASFCDLKINVGDLANRILKPACDKITQATKPLHEVTTKLTEPLPALGELSGGLSLLDLADIYKPVEAQQARDLVDALNQIDQFTNRLNAIANLGDEEGWVEYGELFGSAKENRNGTVATLTSKDLSKREAAKELIADVQQQLERDFEALTVAATSPKASTTTSSFKKSIGKTKVRIPLLDDPSTALCLLLGKDVSLFEVDLPKVELEFEYSEFFPVVGPIGARVGGMAGLTVEMGFGYDTYGFRTRKAADGFFIADLDAAGNDRAEITVTAGLFAAAEINIVVARAGAGGGIYIDIFLNLHDENGDGKVRFYELAKVTQPHHLFDLGGRIYGKIFAYYEIGFRAFGKWVRVAGDRWEREQTILDFNSKTRPSVPEEPEDFFTLKDGVFSNTNASAN